MLTPDKLQSNNLIASFYDLALEEIYELTSVHLWSIIFHFTKVEVYEFNVNLKLIYEGTSKIIVAIMSR